MERMDLTDPLRLLPIAAAVPALAGCALAWSCRRRRAALATWIRGLLALVLLLIAALTALLGVSLLGYARLLQDAEVATLSVRQIEAQHFSVELLAPPHAPTRFELRGDEWQLDARVLRWNLPAALAGAPPLYRLERLSGRYRDVAQEREATRSVHPLAEQSLPDLWTLRQQFPQWLQFVDADFGSAAYLPLIDGARYRVSLSPRGGLIAQPADADTQRLLDENGW
jgi:hypothetical protein